MMKFNPFDFQKYFQFPVNGSKSKKDEAPKEEKADLSELSKELEKLKSQLSELKKNSN